MSIKLQQSGTRLYEQCFREHYQALCFFASGMLHDDVASEDVVQEVFVRLLKMGRSFDSDDHLLHYLYVAVRNLCIDKAKADQRLVSLESSDEPRNDGEKPQMENFSQNVSSASADNIEIQIIRAECIRMIAEAVNELSEGQRAVFKMAYLEGLSNEKIAQALGISVNTVKVQKQRAKARLREKLHDIYPLLFVLVKYASIT